MKTKILLFIFCATISASFAQTTPTPTPVVPAGDNFIEMYGFVMTDIGYNLNQVNPQWYDAMRPSRLPAYKNQFGADGNAYASARQSRFGVKTTQQTTMGEFKAVFDFDLYGVGADAGQTTIRARHLYGQLGHFGAGLTESAFMDLDVFPNTTEYWGPNGMVFLRNAQFRWIPILGPSELVFALENPGASGDQGIYGDRVELSGITPHFNMPDLSGHYRSAHSWGYVQLGAIVRNIAWEDLNATDSLDFTGSVTGYGVSLSSNIKFGKSDVLRLQGTYGAGVENYFNDAPIDVAAKANYSDAKTPIKGEALGNIGAVIFLDHSWNNKYTSSFGYSMVQIDNSDLQDPSAYKKGQYIAANILYNPLPNVMAGFEVTYIDRNNFSDGFNVSATRVNFSFKYNFSQRWNKQ